MGGWLQDLRYASRMIAKNSGTSALAVVALALGIGLTTTMFSIVQGAILRGLPFEEPEKIQYLSVVTPDSPNRGQIVTFHDFTDWRSRQQSFESLEGYNRTSITITGARGYPERLRGAKVTPGAFRALRAAPVVGRNFNDSDAAPGAPAVMIIGYSVWEARFQSRPDAIGQTLNVNGIPTAVIGVMPPTFAFPQVQNAWLPLSFTLAPKRGTGGGLNVFARLKGDISEARAAVDLQGISDQLETTYPENKGVRARVEPYVHYVLGPQVVSTMFAMLGAVFGVMLIACVNVTNLQLARAADRTKEVAVRVALGAGRWRIVRQTLVEGLVLSTAGALAGLGLAWAGTTMFMRAIADTNPPFWIDVRLDPAVLLFVTGITVAAALVSSLVPGWRLSRTDVNGSLKDEGRGTTSLRMGRFTRWLVVVEVAVSCVLLVVSGLMIRSIVQSSHFTYPFATTDVFWASIAIDERTFQKPNDIARSNVLVEEQLSQVSGVTAIALATDYPRGGGGGVGVAIDGHTFAASDDYPRAQVIEASTGYFDVLRVKPLLGRVFNPNDRDGGLLVAVVDEGFARRHLPEGPIGRRIRLGQDGDNGLTFDEAKWLTVVGVVPSLADEGSEDQATQNVFRPLAQWPTRSLQVFASTLGDPLAITSGVRDALARVGEGTPIADADSLGDHLWQQGWAVRVFGGLFATFGVAALVLASAGLYGVMAFGVKQRTQEIGVRLAMGAGRGRVLRMILWQGTWRVAIAIAVGLGPGWWVGGLMSNLLRGVSPGDPLVLSVTAATLLLSGIAASLVPAFRAAGVDPIVALRGDS